MTERINHGTEARKLLDAGHRSQSIETAKLNQGEAQVHATLALVEQQKIANLIALGNAERGPYRYLDAGKTKLGSEDAFGAAAQMLGIGKNDA